MDLVAEIEDDFDIILPLNLLPDLETIGQVADAVSATARGACRARSRRPPGKPRYRSGGPISGHPSPYRPARP